LASLFSIQNLCLNNPDATPKKKKGITIKMRVFRGTSYGKGVYEKVFALKFSGKGIEGHRGKAGEGGCRNYRKKSSTWGKGSLFWEPPGSSLWGAPVGKRGRLQKKKGGAQRDRLFFMNYVARSKGRSLEKK